MPSFKKWLKNIVPAMSSRRALQKALKARLKAVAYYLRQIVKDDGATEETVHQLRVWSRRTKAVLMLFRPETESPAWDKLTKTIKKYRQYAGPLRDFDVMVRRLQEADPPIDQRVLVEVEVARVAVLDELVETIQEKKIFRRGVSLLKKQSKAILAEVKTTLSAPFRDELIPRLRSMIVTFFERGVADLTQPANLHGFRVAVKELRYALEISGTALANQAAIDAYEHLAALQEQLGTICDYRAAIDRYRALEESIVEEEGRESLAALIAAEEARLAEALAAFFKHWTAAQRAKWTHLLQDLIAVPVDDLDADLPVAIHDVSIAGHVLPADDPDHEIAPLPKVKRRRKKAMPKQSKTQVKPKATPEKSVAPKIAAQKVDVPKPAARGTKKTAKKKTAPKRPTAQTRPKRRRPSPRRGSRPE